jgi:DNA-binding protein HU-beta
MAASTITRKQLASSLAADYQLSKRAGNALLDNLVSLITKHLKRGEKIRIAGLGILQVLSAQLAWGVIPPLARQLKSKPRKKLRSVQAKN